MPRLAGQEAKGTLGGKEQPVVPVAALWERDPNGNQPSAIELSRGCLAAARDCNQLTVFWCVTKWTTRVMAKPQIATKGSFLEMSAYPVT